MNHTPAMNPTTVPSKPNDVATPAWTARLIDHHHRNRSNDLLDEAGPKDDPH